MTEQDYGLLVEVDDIKKNVQRILDHNRPFAFDIETGYDGEKMKDLSLHAHHPRFKVVGISFSDDPTWARYIPLAHDAEGSNAPEIATARLLWVLLQTGRGVPHNAPFELAGMGRYFRDKLWNDTFFGEAVRKSHGFFKVFSDTMIQAFLSMEFKPLGVAGLTGVGVGLKGLTKYIFGHTQMTYDSLFEEKISDVEMKKSRFNELDLTDDVVYYACEDSARTMAIHEHLYPALEDSFIHQLEISLLPILAEMEYEGLPLDWEAFEAARVNTEELLAVADEAAQNAFSERLGTVVSVNFNSPVQVKDLLYERLALPVQYDKKTKKPSTSEVALKDLARKEPILENIMRFREVKKLLSSYLNKYINELSYAEDGRAHPKHKQLGAATGRFSVEHVSYQQWPKPYEYDIDGFKYYLNFRNFLKAPEGYRIVGFDYNAVEMRVLAGETQEKELMKAFITGEDIHKSTAAAVFGIPLDEVDPYQRQAAKGVNFGIVYGQGATELGKSLGMTRDEAQEFLGTYYGRFSQLKGWMDKTVHTAQLTGYVYTHFGRKTRIWEYDAAAEASAKARTTKNEEARETFQKIADYARPKGDRNAVNAIIQGTAADICKIAMVRAHKAIVDAGLQDKIRMFMTMHDALEFLVHESITDQQVVDLLSDAVSFPILDYPPIRADWHVGQRWGEVLEIVRDDDGAIVGFEWGKETYETAEAAYEAQRASEEVIPEKPVQEVTDDPIQGLTIEMPDLPDAEEWANFRGWLTERPGSATITMCFPIGEKNLDVLALIYGTDVETIQSTLTGAKITVRES